MTLAGRSRRAAIVQRCLRRGLLTPEGVPRRPAGRRRAGPQTGTASGSSVEPGLRRALTHRPEPGRRKGSILTDLARATLQLREVEPAGVYSEGLVRLTQQCSGLIVKTLRTPDSELAPFAGVAAVKHLRQQLPAAA